LGFLRFWWCSSKNDFLLDWGKLGYRKGLGGKKKSEKVFFLTFWQKNTFFWPKTQKKWLFRVFFASVTFSIPIFHSLALSICNAKMHLGGVQMHDRAHIRMSLNKYSAFPALFWGFLRPKTRVFGPKTRFSGLKTTFQAPNGRSDQKTSKNPDADTF